MFKRFILNHPKYEWSRNHEDHLIKGRILLVNNESVTT